MPTQAVDTGLVLWTKTRKRRMPDLGKIVVRRREALENGGMTIGSISLPAITMHIAALEEAGCTVRRIR